MCTASQTAKSPFYSIRRGEYHPHSESFLLNQVSLKTFGHTLQVGFHGDSEDHHRCIMGNSWCGSLEDAGEWGRGQKEAELENNKAKAQRWEWKGREAEPCRVMGLDKEFAFGHLGLKMHLGMFGTSFVASV